MVMTKFPLFEQIISLSNHNYLNDNLYVRVSSTATTKSIVEILIEKFRPDMKMLEVPEYALYEIHESGEKNVCSLGPS